MNAWLAAAALLVAAGVVVAYFRLAGGHALSLWTAVLALVVAVPFLGGFAVMAFNPRRSTVWSTGTTRIDVSGDLPIVQEHCLTTLLAMGARIVHIAPDEIVAATGARLLWFWLGNRVTVEILHPEPDTGSLRTHVVRVSSAKLDYITTNRTRRDLAEFRASWVFGSSTPASSPSGSGASQPTLV